MCNGRTKASVIKRVTMGKRRSKIAQIAFKDLYVDQCFKTTGTWNVFENSKYTKFIMNKLSVIE